MIYVFATVSAHKHAPAYEADDTIIVLDVISVPQGTAYNPTLQLAAFNFVKSHLKELDLTSADIDSVFIGGGGNSDLNQAINARRRHLNDLGERTLPNLNWLEFVKVQNGNWYSKR